MDIFIRHPIDIPIQVLEGQWSPPTHHHLLDIGLGGLSFDSDQRLELGSLLRIRFPCIDPDFETTVGVVWCKPYNRDPIFEVGAAFLDQEEAYRARMVEQLCHIEHYRRQTLEHEGRRLSRQEAALEWIGKHAAGFPTPGLSGG